MDPLIVAALIAAIASLATAALTAAMGKKISETHKQVSENSHKNDKPTVLDLIAEVREEQKATNRLIVEHIAWHLEDSK